MGSVNQWAFLNLVIRAAPIIGKMANLKTVWQTADFQKPFGISPNSNLASTEPINNKPKGTQGYPRYSAYIKMNDNAGSLSGAFATWTVPVLTKRAFTQGIRAIVIDTTRETELGFLKFCRKKIT